MEEEIRNQKSATTSRRWSLSDDADLVVVVGNVFGYIDLVVSIASIRGYLPLVTVHR
jgi:hypothetical protein